MALSGLAVTVEWWADDRVPARLQRKVARLVEEIAPQLNEMEAALDDLHRLASNGYEWLMPKIEVTLPLYEEGEVFRLRLLRLEETQMVLETRQGEAVAEVRLH